MKLINRIVVGSVGGSVSCQFESVDTESVGLSARRGGNLNQHEDANNGILSGITSPFRLVLFQTI